MSWYITNKSSFILGTDKKYDTNIQSEIIIDGYVVPRFDVFEQYQHLGQKELINQLYQNYQKNFIHYVKGVFTIIMINPKGFEIYSDRHSIKKYFIFKNDKEFFISNSLSLISENFNLEVSNENVALFSLTSHFFNGNTFFKNIESNLPAEYISFESNELVKSNYWKPEEIFKKNRPKTSKEHYANNWSAIVGSYITFLDPKKISLTLTGGNDSRMVLAALLAQKISFHSFTFGNPSSYDGFISNKIKETIKLDHNFYYVENPTKEWFLKQAEELITYGQGLINIHRAHRNDAIKKVKEQIRDVEMVFTGLVGGEYFKEPSFDNVTLPLIFKSLITTKSKAEGISIVYEHLKRMEFNTDQINLEQVYFKLKKFLNYGIGLNYKEKKFLYTYLFYGCAHHTQDSNVFSKHIKFVVNPFMDIDFIEIMASHPKWYVNKKFNFLNRFFHSHFFIETTHILAPQLSTIPYAKKGKYTADDILNHKCLYLLKRFLYFIKKDRDQYPANFPMEEWLYNFCKDEMSKFSPEITGLVNYQKLNNLLEQLRSQTTEKNWHIVTNPINWNLIYENYKKN